MINRMHTRPALICLAVIILCIITLFIVATRVMALNNAGLFQPHPNYQLGFADSPAKSQRPQDWDGLVGLWMPGLGATGGSLHGWSRHRTAGTLSNMELSTDWTQTDIGPALTIDGVDEHIGMGNPTALQLTDYYTIMVWMTRLADNGTYERMLSKSDPDLAGSRDWDYWFQVTNTDVLETGVATSSSAFVYLQSTSTVALNQWYSLTATKNTTEFKIYIDGTLNASGITAGVMGPAAVRASTFNLGRLGDSGSWLYSFNGRYAQVRVYNRELTAKQIADIYQDPWGIVRPRTAIRGFEAVVPSAEQILQPGPFWW